MAGQALAPALVEGGLFVSIGTLAFCKIFAIPFALSPPVFLVFLGVSALWHLIHIWTPIKGIPFRWQLIHIWKDKKALQWHNAISADTLKTTLLSFFILLGLALFFNPAGKLLLIPAFILSRNIPHLIIDTLGYIRLCYLENQLCAWSNPHLNWIRQLRDGERFLDFIIKKRERLMSVQGIPVEEFEQELSRRNTL